MTRFLRQINTLHARLIAAAGEELRTPIYISGGVPGLPDRVVFIPHFAIHNGLPPEPDYGDTFGLDYVAGDYAADADCDTEDAIA